MQAKLQNHPKIENDTFLTGYPLAQKQNAAACTVSESRNMLRIWIKNNLPFCTENRFPVVLL